jgi:hypothetical protein
MKHNFTRDINRIWGVLSSNLWCITLRKSVESQPTFRTHISPLSSGSKNKPSKKLAYSKLRYADLLLGLFYEPEDEGDKFL